MDDQSGLFRLLSPEGQELLVTGIRLSVGDRFLAPDNRLYEVVRTDDDVAMTRFLGRRQLRGAVGPPAFSVGAAGAESAAFPGGSAAAGLPGPTGWGSVELGAAAAPSRRSPLGIYHTHSDESYVPTSGTTNKPWNGDIFQVGRAMSLLWRKAGLQVLHSYRRHDPHDGEAYLRSRRTAVELLRRRPAALFDVHRDTPPAWVYRRVINGQRLASVLLVLGRQNPNLWANEAFAFSIKGYADGVYPGLIRGILYAAADYNQDLHPRALLAEVGSTYNSLDEALVGARFFSAVVPAVLFGIRIDPQRMPPVSPEVPGAQASRSAWRAAALLVSLVVAGGALFVLLNENAYETASTLAGRLNRLRERVLRRLRVP